MKFKSFIFVILSVLILSMSAQARKVTLQWDPNSEPDLSHYVVYWGSSSGDYTNNSGDIGLITTYSCTLPDDGQIYYFAVTAVDEAGLESDYSNEVNTDAITEEPEAYLYLPPAAPSGNNISELMKILPDGTVIITLGNSKFTVTLPNGTIIDIEGVTAIIRTLN